MNAEYLYCQNSEVYSQYSRCNKEIFCIPTSNSMLSGGDVFSIFSPPPVRGKGYKF